MRRSEVRFMRSVPPRRAVATNADPQWPQGPVSPWQDSVATPQSNNAALRQNAAPATI
jgi:hypothetical protein